MGARLGHRARTSIVVAVLLGLLFAENAQAQTDAERQAQDLLAHEKWIGARQKAEAILRRSSRSIIGHYVLGVCLHRAEGALARAMFHLGRARELYEGRYGTQRSPVAPWQLHREILYAIQMLAGEMELYDYQLDVQAFHDYLYDPDLIGERAWPLMKVGRYEEARRFALLAVRSNDAWQVTLGRNALCAIEGEARHRRAWFDACNKALESARDVGREGQAQAAEESPVAVRAYNAALAAFSVLRFEDAKRILEDGARRLEMTTANPWRLLVLMQLSRADLSSTLEAVREMQRWRARQPAYLREQDRSETDAVFALVLLAVGEPDHGLQAITRAIERPDRRALTTERAEQASGAHALVRRALRRQRAERMLEQASASGVVDRVEAWARAAWERFLAWRDRERVRGAIASDDRLVSTVRLFLHGGLEPLPVWLVGDLVSIVGPGVFATALRKARRDVAQVPGLRPYYDALEAEVALADGDEARALRKVRESLEHLPQNEGMLRARVAAIGAESAEQLGQRARSLGYYEQAMQLDAGVVRRMGIAIPARVVLATGGSDADAARDMLERSPRLTESKAAFVVRIDRAGAVLRACLYSVHGALLSCAEARPLTPSELKAEKMRSEPPEARAARLADAFHRSVFGSRSALSAIDMQSLDGRTTVSTEAAREHLQDVVRELTKEAGQ